ncbi:L,D-transpeptidase family protein [Aerococcaceae bacterium WGS1372]
MERVKQIPKKYLITILIVIVILLVYVIGASYFSSHFLPRTYAGPIKVSQMTVDYANETLEEEIPTSTLVFQEKDENIGYIELGQLNIQINMNDSLQQALEQQNKWAWPFALVRPKKVINIKEQIQLETQVVEALIPNLGVHNDDREPTIDAAIIKDEEGAFQVREEVYGNQVSSESLTEAIKNKVSAGIGELELEEAYIQPTKLAEGEAIQEQLAELEKMKNSTITLEFAGNSETIPKELIESWIYIDESNELQVDAEAVDAYIVSLNEQYSGLLNPWTFTSTYQGDVQVQPGTYGWYIDRFEEAPLIIEDVHNGAQVTREPVVYGSSYGMGNDIGGDYVEVDITYQMMFIYKDYQLVLETPIVSGIVGAETVPGAYQVWNKEVDTELVGYNVITERDYVQPVNYWIAFDDNAQGIHDASWQATFGGNAYVTAGSQGCINTPPGIMGQVFGLVEYGMPVMIF